MVAAGTPARCWVVFTDKGSAVSSMQVPGISARALARRAKTLPAGLLTDASDFPVYPRYIRQVEALGGILLNESRWLNAASFLLTPEQSLAVRSLPAVRSIQPVAISRIRPVDRTSADPVHLPRITSENINYTAQLNALSIPLLHSLGINGKGVLVGMLDSGFRWRDHEALASSTVVAEFDFIHNRSVTSNRPDDTPGQDAHGTMTFSVIGGFAPGHLVGAAWGASFALAKTELIYPSSVYDTDSLREEDNWVAGIEWLEGLGADVVSSSLAYSTFVDGPGYSFAHGDFDGRTSLAARAAARAARLGVVVCTAMGNEGNGDGTTGTLLTPADADSIISVGACDSSGILAYFSSTGPTNDARIKPDVIAPGVNIACAVIPGPSTYSAGNGTSFATPLTAGTAALLLSVRPEMTPVEVRDILRSTATPITDAGSYPQSPNNFTGWGMINAFRAVAAAGVIFGNEPVVTTTDSLTNVSAYVISPSGINPSSVILSFASADSGAFTQVVMECDSPAIYPTSGKYRCTIPVQPLGSILRFLITARDSTGRNYQSPHPGSSTFWTLRYGSSGLYDPAMHPSAYLLHPNYPNPFNSGTTISYDLPAGGRVKLSVYNLLGQHVATLADDDEATGPHKVYFLGESLSSGVYFYRLSTPAYTFTRKMILLR
jgi:serine protease AprX